MSCLLFYSIFKYTHQLIILLLYRYAGVDRQKARVEKAITRCNIFRDTGKTRCDPSRSITFCLHFARGACSKGHECNFLHRLPTPTDQIELTRDVFGREKHRDEKDDMSGTGSFEREGKTLYISGLHPRRKSDMNIMEQEIRKHFSEWGTIENIRVIHDKNIAFVRYTNRLNAEFAKEAMIGQSLDNKEIIIVRWARDDPNPAAIAMKRKRETKQALDAFQKALPEIGEDGKTIADYEKMLAKGGYTDDNTANNKEGEQGGEQMDQQTYDYYAYYYYAQQQAAAGGGGGNVEGEEGASNQTEGTVQEGEGEGDGQPAKKQKTTEEGEQVDTSAYGYVWDAEKNEYVITDPELYSHYYYAQQQQQGDAAEAAPTEEGKEKSLISGLGDYGSESDAE